MIQKGLGNLVRENLNITWGEVTSWEDVLAPEEKKKIRDVLAKTSKENLCPLLRQIGEGEADWIYCQIYYKKFKERGIYTEESKMPGLEDPRYHSSVGYTYFHTFCSDRFNDCMCFKELEKSKIRKA